MKRRLLLALGVVFLAGVGLFSYLDGAQAHVRITTDVTWSETIRPIFIQKCMPCHHPGGAAPDYADLTFYGDDTNPGARAWATAVEEEVLTGRMPPWNADERFGEFSNERTLTEQEIELITAWVEGGGPQGPLQNLPVPEQFQRTDWAFGAPDLIIPMPKGHVVPAEQRFDVKTVKVPVEIEEDTYVTGYEFLVDNPKNIARITAYIHDPEGQELKPIEVEVQKPYDPLAGEEELKETRMRPMPEGPHFLGQWTKGQGPVLFPESAGRLLRKGSTIEMRIDYVRPMWADWSQEIRDSTKLGLFVAGPDEEVDLLVESKRIENPDFVIEAEKKQQVQATMTFDENVHVIELHPHLGPLATKVQAKLEYPDGLEKVILWVPEFHQRWTMSYRFEEPVPAPAGTKMTLTGWYDNTADNWDNPNDPPEDVATGPEWLDERLYAMVDYTLDDHLKTKDVIKVTEEAPRGSGMLGGFNPLSPKAGEGPEEEKSVEEVTKDIVDTLQIPDEPERIRPASNGYHQVQGMIRKPGHFMLYIYDDEMNPLDPRNFSGEITLDDGETQPLVHHHPGDEYLSAWLAPTLPQEFEAKVNLGGKDEAFAFRFESLSEPESEEKGGEEAASSKQAFVQPPHGGWLGALERTGHQVEATLEERGQLRLYFFDADMNPVDPRNFRGLALVVDPETGDTDGSKTLLKHPDPRAEYLEAKISPELPLTVRTRIWVADTQEELEFEFEELTEEPWDFGGFDTGAEDAKPLILGPHGSPEFYEAGNGFHFVEAAMPRPGELRLYFYDEWKNPVDPALFSGSVRVGDTQQKLERFKRKDPYLTAFLKPEFPMSIDANIWMTGEEEQFTFDFEDVTIDPAIKVPAGHMDHTPLHGGTFFMADNMFHHLEGTMPRPGEFRLYFYDDFKQPIDPRNFDGTAYIEHLDEETGEVTEEAFDLFHAKPADQFLTAMVPAEWPITLYTMVNLGGEMKRFDFAFEEVTVEPPQPRVASAPQLGGGPAAAGTHSHYRPPLTIPETADEIMAEIQIREQDLMQRITARDWNTLYQPAWDVRDLVRALSKMDTNLTVRQKGRLKMLVGAVNRTANDIDNVAHTEDPPRIQGVADELADHIDELGNIFGAKA